MILDVSEAELFLADQAGLIHSIRRTLQTLLCPNRKSGLAESLVQLLTLITVLALSRCVTASLPLNPSVQAVGRLQTEERGRRPTYCEPAGVRFLIPPCGIRNPTYLWMTSHCETFPW
jgi:hypothetical protein